MRELSLHVLDIAQNSIRANAKLTRITLCEDSAVHTLEITVADNGCGMSEEQLARVCDPFFTTRETRKIGLGVSLFQLAAEQTGGSFSIQSAPGEGTTTRALFHTNHLDCAPLGDMASTVQALITMNCERDFLYTHTVDGNSFTLDTAQLREMLDGVPFSEPDIAAWLLEYLNENIQTLERNTIL